MNPRQKTPSIAAQVSRRRFLRDLGVATGCVATAATLAGCEVAELKTSGGGTSTELNFDMKAAPFMDLTKAGKMVAVNASGKMLLLIRASSHTVVALSRMCPHAGCDLAPDGAGTWLEKSQTVLCGCHNSEFKLDGSYVKGSVNGGADVGDLISYPVTFNMAMGTGTVDLSGAA